MAEFRSTLAVRMLPESEDTRWQLVEPLVFQSDVMDCEIAVPVGFVTNFVSFAPLKNVGQRPATLHDYLYSCTDVPRELADQVFLEALESVGVDEVLAHVMFDAVRLFGGGHKDNLYTFYT